MLFTKSRGGNSPRALLRAPGGSWHAQALFIYLLIIVGHFAEHLIQVAQVFLLGWARADAGGLLGLVFSSAAENEVLHITYNSLQLTGLVLLAYSFRTHRAAHGFWMAALVAQSWHWLEHVFLLTQMLTGHYFYGAVKQMSVLEKFIPRLELHFIYNLIVFVPTVIAVILYVRLQKSNEQTS